MGRPALTEEQRYAARLKRSECSKLYYKEHPEKFAVRDYSNAYIYQLVCDESDLVYIGASAIQPHFREKMHHRDITRRTTKTFETMASIAPGPAWRLEVIKIFPCVDKSHLNDLETLYISYYGDKCINRNKKYKLDTLGHVMAKYSPEYLPASL